MKVEDILEKLVGFNTIKDKENSKIINYIESFLLDYDFKTIKKDKYLIMESNFGEKDTLLGFLGHTDTVEALDTWKYDPFKLTRDENKYYGLGVCDMKGGIAAFLTAISKIDKLKVKNKIRVYFTYDEEIGFSGIKDVKSFEKENGFPKTMIIGEPTNNEILVGSKGLIEYKVIFSGIKVHSSTPEKGKSAIFEAISFINELKEFYNNNIKSEEDKAFLVPYTTFNLGVINGGKEINSVPNKCEVMFDFRTINKNEDLVIDFVEKLCLKYNVKKEILNKIPAFINKSKYVEDIKTCAFITEASFLRGERLILGPGPVNPHEKNEYIYIDSLNKCVEQYIDIIEKECM